MEPKSALEQNIRCAYRLIVEYEHQRSLAEDPKAKLRCEEEINEQWALIERWVPDYLRICQQSEERPPEDIQQIIVSRGLDSTVPIRVVSTPENAPKVHTGSLSPTPPTIQEPPETPEAVDVALSETSEKPHRDVSICHPEPEVYASYAAGLRRLRQHLGPGHPRYSDALAYEQRLSENIARSRLHGDTETRRAERSEIIGHLNELASSAVGTPFNELCSIADEPTSEPYPDVPATILIPAGPFRMGSSKNSEAYDNEKPCHEVELQGYRIGHYPVTNAQYARFLADNPNHPVPYADEARARSYNWDPQSRTYPEGKADHPVVLVSWHDAEAYCDWLSQVIRHHYRLPTEEEWEKAARGGFPDRRRYPWGDEWQPGYCNVQELGRNGTTSVHEFEQINRSPFGVVDMAGNVWEWTASRYEPYPGSPHEGPHYGQSRRVVRGGSWRSDPQGVRISCRGRYEPDARRPYLGFRVALDARVETMGTASQQKTKERPERADTSAQMLHSASKEVPVEVIDRSALRQNLTTYFNASELRTLCFDLNVDYDSLQGEGKGDKARELVAYMERHGRISELVEACKRLYPKVTW